MEQIKYNINYFLKPLLKIFQNKHWIIKKVKQEKKLVKVKKLILKII